MEAGLNPEKNKLVVPETETGLPEGSEGANDFYTHQKRQRKKIAALVFLGLLAILISVFYVVQMRNILAVPLPGGITLAEMDKRVAKVEGIEVVKPIEDEDASVLKQRDTDEDGINDFEELYIYKTSPYLADTDSDGTNDIDEIKAQEDPNCPKGQNCFRTSELYAEEQAAKEAELKLTANEIRALIQATGKFTPEQIGLLTDAELLDFYAQMLAENPELAKQMGVQTTPDITTKTPVKTPAEILAEVDKTSVEEIKNILRQQGIDDTTLNQIDDATLRELYKKAYEEANKKIQ